MTPTRVYLVSEQLSEGNYILDSNSGISGL